MGHTITALQARAISNLARKHRNEAMDLQERQFTEMQALEVELFGSPKPISSNYHEYRFTVNHPSGSKFEVHGWDEVKGLLSEKQRQELADARVSGLTYFDSMGRSWVPKA